jgi:hypothetical protein
VAHIAAGHVAVDDLLGAAVGVAGERRAVAHEDPAALVAALDALIVLVVEDHLAGDRRAAGSPWRLAQFGGRGDGGDGAFGGAVHVVSTSPKASCVLLDSSGLSADPATRMTFSEDVSYLAWISGPSSTMRCNIVGTATSMSALWSAIIFSVFSALNRRR